jgi:hypothetical protein
MPRKSRKPTNEARESDAPLDIAHANDTRATSMGSEPSDEDIRMRAYQKFLERGGVHGNHLEDWVKAKEELKR